MTATLLKIILLLPAIGAITTAQQPLQFQHSSTSKVIREPSGRIRGFQDRNDKDFVIGGLFPVHNNCEDIRPNVGTDVVEAMLFAIDLINADSRLLPNLTLGYDIRDTCLIESTGLDEALELAVIDSPRVAQLSQCPADDSSDQPISVLGIVGAAASRVSIPVASLGRLFQIPQISYASTSPDLSNQRDERFTFFFRTVVPDDIQVQAQIALVQHFNWNHISVIYSDNSYGANGRREIVRLAGINGICIDLDEGLADAAPPSRYQEVADELNRSMAEVVLVFALDDTARELLDAFTKIPNHRRLTWIASDGWSENEVLIQWYGNTLVGMFGTTPATVHIDKFEDYLSQLTIASNQRNPWFPDFFSAVMNCTLNSTCNDLEAILGHPQNFAIPRAIEAVYAFAHAVQDYLNDNCDQPVEWNRANYSCKGQNLKALNGVTMLQYLSNVNFSLSELTGRNVEFNDLGYITSGMYDIYNFQDTDSDEFELVRVGNWSTTSGIKLSNVQFGLDETGGIVSTPLISQCQRCAPGQFLNPDTSCCGSCSPCTGQNYSNNSTSRNCSQCSEFMWGNNPVSNNIGSSFCVDLNSTSLQFSHPGSIVMVILSLLGLIAVGFTAVVFGVFWNTPVIKSSGREQMILLLIGIILSYVVAFIYVSPPVLPICIIRRIGLWFCFSLMFGALMVKIIRVTRIFLRKHGLKNIPFTTPKYQILFTFIVVAGQMLLVLGSLIQQHPVVARNVRLNAQNNDDFATVVVSCTPDHLAFIIILLLYNSAIVLVTTICGIISFKYPKNFNEAKHISLCTFALVVIWLAYIPSYFATASQQEFQSTTVSLAVIMTASAILICNFAPRLFILFFDPEKKDITTTTMQGSSQIPSQEIRNSTIITDHYIPPPGRETNGVGTKEMQQTEV